MKKQLNPLKRISELVRDAGLKAIQPFTQQAPLTEEKSKDEKKNKPELEELFSHFTANIIKQDIIFTR